MLENYLTPTQFAKELGMSRQGVHKMLREGRVHFERIGKQYFILRKELEKISRFKSNDKLVSELGFRRA